MDANKLTFGQLVTTGKLPEGLFAIIIPLVLVFDNELMMLDHSSRL